MSGSSPAPRDAREMLQRSREFLARKGIEEARLEAELLVAHALGLERLALFMQLDRPVTASEVERARELLVRRGRREPLAYIVGRREFYGRAFSVGPGVLIPRPETELIVDRAREILGARAASAAAFIADVGTGSGCLAITLALEIPGAAVLAVDISREALERARANAALLGATIDARHGDGLAVLADAARAHGRTFDLIVCNPPYVTREECATLAPEVRDHEPELALFAPDGDADHWLRRLLAETPPVLAADGTLLVELGAGQGPRALDLARGSGWSARLVCDYARIERVLEVRRVTPSAPAARC
jgi:release factor glutamine methyltransferase